MARRGVVTKQQRAFAEAYVATGVAARAAKEAGYALPDANASRVMAHPAVQQTIRQIQERRILNDLMPKALDLLEKVIMDGTFKPEVRVKAAAEVRQWYGQVTGQGAGDKSPEDMTPGEIADRIAALRAKQAQLADAAKVIDAEVIEDPTPGADVFG